MNAIEDIDVDVVFKESQNNTSTLFWKILFISHISGSAGRLDRWTKARALQSYRVQSS
jgi:hypothetical protein